MAMNTTNQEISTDQTPKWLITLFAFIAAVLGVAALWVAWFQYGEILNQPQANWYVWIRPVLMAVVGILCLVALVLFVAGRPSAWSVLVGGLSIIPIILFSNLVILILRVIQNIMQGNTDPFLSRFSESPLKVILNIIVVVIVLSVIQGIKKSKDNN
jgi:hypothetical protein